MGIWRTITTALGEAIFKPNCGMCGKPSYDYICQFCGRQLLAHRTPEPIQTDGDFPCLLFAWGIYEQTLKQAIARCKYDNHPEIAFYLGKAMGRVWQAHPTCSRLGKLAVIPIPMHPEKLAQRGFNQAEELARGFCAITHLPLYPHWLERIKNTKPQMATKSKQERTENLHQAFRAHIPPSAQVLLVDDIYTTGATIREAVQALGSVGGKTEAIAVLARPRFPVPYNKQVKLRGG